MTEDEVLAEVFRRFLTGPQYVNALGDDDDPDLDLILDGTIEISNEEFQVIKKLAGWT